MRYRASLYIASRCLRVQMEDTLKLSTANKATARQMRINNLMREQLHTQSTMHQTQEASRRLRPHAVRYSVGPILEDMNRPSGRQGSASKATTEGSPVHGGAKELVQQAAGHLGKLSRQVHVPAVQPHWMSMRNNSRRSSRFERA